VYWVALASFFYSAHSDVEGQILQARRQKAKKATRVNMEIKFVGKLKDKWQAVHLFQPVVEAKLTLVSGVEMATKLHSAYFLLHLFRTGLNQFGPEHFLKTEANGSLMFTQYQSNEGVTPV